MISIDVGYSGVQYITWEDGNKVWAEAEVRMYVRIVTSSLAQDIYNINIQSMHARNMQIILYIIYRPVSVWISKAGCKN